MQPDRASTSLESAGTLWGRCKGELGEFPVGTALGEVRVFVSGPSPTPNRTCHHMVDGIGEVFEDQSDSEGEVSAWRNNLA